MNYFRIISILPALLILVLSCNRDDMYSHLSSRESVLIGISIFPANTLLSQGETRSLKAAYVYSDGSTTDITALAQWTATGNVTLGVNGSITAGSSAGAATVTASYNGFTSISNVYVEPATSIFVSTASGNDSTGYGSSNKPFKTLKYAYDYATSNSKSKIFVAAGEYNMTSQLEITQSIAIYGGYSAADWSRNIQTNRTRINEAIGSTGSSSNPAAPIVISAGSPELNGLYIKGSSSASTQYSAAVYISGGSPSIVACSFDGGVGTNTIYGLYITYATVTVDSCIIKNSKTDIPCLDEDGVFLFLSGSLKLYNSMISVQNGTTGSDAINAVSPSGAISLHVYNCALIANRPEIDSKGMYLSGNISGYACNNTIVTLSKKSTGLLFWGLNSMSSNFFFANNIVYISGSSDSACINFGVGSLSKIYFYNNLFYNVPSTAVPVPVYIKQDSGSTCGASDASTFFSPSNATDNIYGIDPAFCSKSDFHPSSGSKSLNAGMNGSSWPYFPKSSLSSEPIDLDGVSRPATGNWTIGAYQNAK